MNQNLSKRVFGLLLLSFMFLIKTTSWADAGGTLIPFYIYPTSDAIQPLLNAKAAHPNVAMRVILDPNNGPGNTQDPNYVSAISSLQTAGIEVAGYVNTDYNSRPIGDVMSDIAQWQTLYSPNGIFLDLMGTDISYYMSLTSYIKSLGMDFSIGDAGANVSTSYASAVDTVVIANSNTLPNLTGYANWQTSGLPKSAAAMLIWDISTFPTGFIYEAKKFTGWIYITDETDDNWSALSSYFDVLMNALDTVNVGTIFPFYIYPSSTSVIQPLIDAANQYPNVPIWVILNPATGPGTTIDSNYVNAVTQLRAAGINILGYVNTNYGHRSKSLVEKDIRTWISFYKPDGIFLDLMALNHAYYSSITTYAKSLGIQMVVANPGANINQSAGNDVDITNIFENNFLPSPLSQFQNWYNIYPPSALSLICYNISTLPTSFITSASQYFGWIFITDSNDADPYDTYPTYFNSFIQLLSTL